MPQNVTPVANTWPTNFTAAADGDLVDGANFLAVEQDYANALEYLKDNTLQVADAYPLRVVPPRLAGGNWDTVFDGGPGNNAFGLEQQLSSASELFQVDMPRGNGIARATGMLLTLVPTTGHAGLPATMPSAKLWRQPADGSVAVLVATATDASANVAAYEVAHSISVAFSHVIATNDTYWIQLLGEGGANFLAELLVTDMYLTIARV